MSVTNQQAGRQGASSDLDIVLNAAVWLINNAGVIGDLWSRLTGGVTNVKEWVNQTGQEIEVFKIDGGGIQDHYRIPPGQTRSGDMWIPWAESDADYARHHTTFMIGGKPLAYVWQSAKVMRFNIVDAFVPGGTPVVGASGGGGNRRVLFGTDPQGVSAFAVSVF